MALAQDRGRKGPTFFPPLKASKSFSRPFFWSSIILIILSDSLEWDEHAMNGFCPRSGVGLIFFSCHSWTNEMLGAPRIVILERVIVTTKENMERLHDCKA